MCKCSSYAIEIIHLNGNKQIREVENNFSYKTTLSLYHNIKKEYINKEVTVNFIGITQDGEQIFFFGKKNTLVENEKRNIKDLMNVIAEATNELKNQYKIICDKQSYYDKERSKIDHLLVEAVDVETLTDSDKAKIYDEIRRINLMRRDYKILNNIRTLTIPDLEAVSTRINNMIDKYDKQIHTNSQKLKDLINRSDDYSGVHLIKEIQYKDFKDKMRIMAEIQKKYDKIIQFPEKKMIACYNKCS